MSGKQLANCTITIRKIAYPFKMFRTKGRLDYLYWLCSLDNVSPTLREQIECYLDQPDVKIDLKRDLEVSRRHSGG